MNNADHEQISITVSDPDRAAKALCDVFGWQVKSTTEKEKGVRSILVGTGTTYITLCAAAAIDHGPAEKPPIIKPRALTLNHVGIPARNPEALAAWYGLHFDLMVEGAFAYGDGWLIACEQGTPLTEMPAHFGFMLDARAEIDAWKQYFEEHGIDVDAQRNGNAIFIADPEGNSFEIFFDPTLFVAPI
ncbi:VOC family protein [Blastomonas fulva]|uniref:VOC family protein n=1 Tax=Blastomonas fulva TaxID=1550728 RepID=UPI003D2D1746